MFYNQKIKITIVTLFSCFFNAYAMKNIYDIAPKIYNNTLKSHDVTSFLTNKVQQRIDFRLQQCNQWESKWNVTFNAKNIPLKALQELRKIPLYSFLKRDVKVTDLFDKGYVLSDESSYYAYINSCRQMGLGIIEERIKHFYSLISKSRACAHDKLIFINDVFVYKNAVQKLNDSIGGIDFIVGHEITHLEQRMNCRLINHLITGQANSIMAIDKKPYLFFSSLQSHHIFRRIILNNFTNVLPFYFLQSEKKIEHEADYEGIRFLEQPYAFEQYSQAFNHLKRGSDGKYLTHAQLLQALRLLHKPTDAEKSFYQTKYENLVKNLTSTIDSI